MLRNFILDWSGTVVDDLEAVLRATNHVFAHYKASPLTREEFRERFSLPWTDFYRQWLPQAPIDELDKIFWQKMQPEQAGIPLLPHSMGFLQCAQRHHFPVFICSTVDPPSFWGQSDRLGTSSLIRKAYVGVMDKREMIHRILGENQLDPSETVFVGDMVHDVETAHKGRVKSCAVLSGFDPESKLKKAHPDWILRDLRELEIMVEVQLASMQEHPVATVGALIFNDKGECLMLQTQKWSSKWGIPGGKIRRGETAEEALKREVREETNLDVDEIHMVMMQDCIDSREFYRPAHFLLLNYTVRARSGDVKLNDEAQAWQWIQPEQALKLELNRPTRVLIEKVMPSSNNR